MRQPSIISIEKCDQFSGCLTNSTITRCRNTCVFLRDDSDTPVITGKYFFRVIRGAIIDYKNLMWRDRLFERAFDRVTNKGSGIVARYDDANC